MQCLLSFLLSLFRCPADGRTDALLLPPLPESEYDSLETDSPGYQSARPQNNLFF